MVDIAELGFKAETNELKTAKDRLEDLRPAAERAERASERLAKELRNTNSASQLMAAGVSKAGGALRMFGAGILGFATGALASMSFDSIISGARELSAAVAELSTLLPVGSAQLDQMTDAANRMANEFGTNAAFQIKAFYGAVSAGATSTAQAVAVVDSANRLAIGGITDVATGVDILTTATNAYAQTGLTAAEASDALFVGMKAGKTTIGELASALGQVIPIAAALGVDIDELVAGTAALTLQGLSTSQSVTSLRAILSAVAKPTSEAAKLAKQLGLEFSVSSLRAKGLSEFLADVNEKSGGSAENLSILFGSVEALNGALAFAGAGGDSFNSILEQMETKAGQTDEAFAKMTQSLDFRWNSLMQSMQNTAIAFGTVLLSAIVPIMEAIRDIVAGVSPLSPLLQEVGITLAIAFSPLILSTIFGMVGAVASLAATIGGVFVSAVYSAAAAMVAFTLSNPFIALLYAIPLVLAAIYVFRDSIRNVFGIDVVGFVKSAANAISALMVGSFNAIMATWSQLPGAMGDVAVQAANRVMHTMQIMTRNVLTNINFMLSQMSKAVVGTVFEFNAPQFDTKAIVGEFGSWKMDNPFAGQAAEVGQVFKRELNAAFQTDFIGGFASEVGAATEALTIGAGAAAEMGAAVSELGDAATGGGAGKSGKGGAAEKLTELQKIANDFAKLSEPFNQAKSAYDAATEALKNGIITNDQYAQSLGNIEAAFMRAGGSATQWANITNANTESVANQMKDLAENALTRLGDEFINLAVEGKANFGDLAKAIIKDLLRIAWQALVVKPLLGWLGFSDGGAFGGGSGGLGGLLKFAKGGAFTNDVVNKPTLFAFANGGALGVMGEAGPEAVMPLKRGPDGSLGVEMYGGAGNSTKQSVNNEISVRNEYRIEGAISEQRIVDRIRQSAEQTTEDIKKSMVPWLNQYTTDGGIV